MIRLISQLISITDKIPDIQAKHLSTTNKIIDF